MTRQVLASLLAVFAAATASAETIAIRGGTILTVTKGTIENGTVLIRDGKIAAVGTNVSVPADARMLDASGQFVMPGIIDAHSHIAAESINEGAVSVSSMTGIEDVLTPTDIDIYRELAGGVTTSNVLHGSANPIGGKNAVIKHRVREGHQRASFRGSASRDQVRDGRKPEALARRGRPGPVSRDADGSHRRHPGSLHRGESVPRRVEGVRGKEANGGERPDRSAPRPGARALVEILEGKRLVHAHCYRADEILQLLRVAEELGFQIATLQHVLEGYKVAEEIAEHGAGASTFSDWWAYKMEAYDAIPYNAALMVEKGVLVSINSDSAEETRHLNQEAAKTMKWGGLTEEQALALITINPAKQLRIDDRVGSIEVGKDADIAIFDHHPLSVYAVAQTTLVDGEIYFERSRDLERRADMETRRKALLEKQKGESR